MAPRGFRLLLSTAIFQFHTSRAFSNNQRFQSPMPAHSHATGSVCGSTENLRGPKPIQIPTGCRVSEHGFRSACLVPSAAGADAARRLSTGRTRHFVVGGCVPRNFWHYTGRIRILIVWSSGEVGRRVGMLRWGWLNARSSIRGTAMSGWADQDTSSSTHTSYLSYHYRHATSDRHPVGQRTR
jgi:hypothetical protein